MLTAIPLDLVTGHSRFIHNLQALKEFALTFGQIGLITLTYQIAASMLQPAVELYTDRHPKPYSLAIGMCCTLMGLMALAKAPHYRLLLFAVALAGAGSAIFHPESSRVARLASGGRFGLAHSIFQVGGNAGTATGPLLAALIVIPNGRSSLAWFSLFALLAMLVLARVGRWYKRRPAKAPSLPKAHSDDRSEVSSRTVFRSKI